MPNHNQWPMSFRLTVVALATLFLCSCQSLVQEPNADLSPRMSSAVATVSHSEASPAKAPLVSATVVATDDLPTSVYSHDQYAQGPWQPPGLQRPWPHDEYLRDGGDYGLRAGVRPDWTVDGVEQEDTIAHFDTLDGRTLVEPSNRVYIYAPRFGAVRRVDGLFAHEAHDVAYGLGKPEQLARHDELQGATASHQRTRPADQRSLRAGSTYRSRLQSGGLAREQGLAALKWSLLPFENLQIIRHGQFDQREKARLSTAVVAAEAWSQNQALQVLIDNQRAIVDTTDRWTQVVFDVGEPTNPRLRIVKIASAASAVPGETVDFTIRFDNIGDQLIGNVTLIDNLTTRLEFVPDSDESSLQADFLFVPNEGGSLRLRWEITEPLKPGEGGVVRFRCKVR